MSQIKIYNLNGMLASRVIDRHGQKHTRNNEVDLELPDGMTEPEIDAATDMTSGGGGGGGGTPMYISQLVNDVGYITAAGAPVRSVNNMTGAVVLPVLSNQAIENLLT